MGFLTGFQTAYIVDIAVLVVLLIFALVDAKKGFIACIFGFIISVVAFIVSFFCASTVVDATGGLFGLQDLIAVKLTEALSSISVFQIDATQEGLTMALEEAKLPAFLMEMITKNGIQAEAGTTLAQYIAGEVSPFVTLVVTGIVLFILCKLILSFVEKILTSLVSNIAFLGAVNSILGAFVGFVKGAFTVCLILSLLSLLTSPELTAFIDQTLFVKTFYHDNPVNLLYGLIFV